jgi:hypothetical protein
LFMDGMFLLFSFLGTFLSFVSVKRLAA